MSGTAGQQLGTPVEPLVPAATTALRSTRAAPEGPTADGTDATWWFVGRWWFRALAVLGLLAVAASYLLGPRLARYAVDLDVYRLGGAAWLQGRALYEAPFQTFFDDRLDFTYPPVAAVLLSPLAWVSLASATVLWRLLTLALVVVAVAVVLRGTGLRTRSATWWWVLAAGVAVVSRLEPIRSTLGYGQVNVLLMVLVLADCLLVRTPWRRGVLVGVVAAFKLTPAVFVLFFLVRRDYRSAATAAVSGVVTTALGFALAPTDSVQYWTRAVFATERIGAFTYASNQNLTGVIARFGASGTLATSLWLGTSLVVLLVGLLGMRRAERAGLTLLTLALNAVVGLLISPVSWAHHWVWVVPALGALTWVAVRGRTRAAAVLAGTGAVLFAVGPQWRLPHDRTSGVEVSWAVWQKVAGNGYVWWALALLVVAALVADRWAPPDTGPTR